MIIDKRDLHFKRIFDILFLRRDSLPAKLW